MGDFVAIGSAVYQACDAATTTPVYYGMVPQGSAVPAVIINRQTAVDDRTWTGVITSADYLVQVVSNRQYPYEAAGVYETVHAALDDKALTVTGYTALRCQRRSTIEYRDPDGYWHVGGLYRIDVYAQ